MDQKRIFMKSMDDFVCDLKAFEATGFPKEPVTTYLEENCIDSASLESFIRYCPERYTRHLIYKSRDFEMLILCWSPGQKAPIHGHEGELCWARVERGTLRFYNYREINDSPLQLELIGHPFDGSAGHLDGPADIHAVENATSEGAVSLHIYSKPYPECDIYDLAAGVKRRCQACYDSIYGQPCEKTPAAAVSA